MARADTHCLAGHGEQLLNAAVHARNFPRLVRTRPRLERPDIQWLVDFDHAEPRAVAESSGLRELVNNFNRNGSPLLGGEAAAPRSLGRRILAWLSSWLVRS